MDVSAILDKLESEGFVKLGRRTGNYRQCHCPFHSEGKERRPSCGVLLVSEYRNGRTYPEGFWHCFACGASLTMVEAVTKLLELHHISQSGKAWLIENVPGFEVDDEFEKLIPESLLQQNEAKYAVNYLTSMVSPTVEYVTEDELSKYRFVSPYMYKRRLTDEVIETYDIGVDLHWKPPGRSKEVPCITFPVHDEAGRTLFVARRSIEGKMFNYPQGVTKPVYGIDKIPKGCKSLIITESCFNALTAVVYGYSAVALLGTGNSYQIDQLKRIGVNEFVLCMDGDEAGKRATNKLKKHLSSVAVVWTMPMPLGKDANDLTKDEFDEIYSRRE